MKKIVALTLVLVMVFALCACGGGKSAAGTYTLTGLKMDGEDYSDYLSLLGMDGVTLVLNKDGTGSLDFMGETVELTWDANELTIEDETTPYTLDGNSLIIVEDGEQMIFTRK